MVPDRGFDSETGEIRQAVICLRSERRSADRQEAGGDTGTGRRARKKKGFQVPISYVRQVTAPERRAGLDRLQPEAIEKSVVSGTHNVSPIVFMLPTLLIFPAWTSIFCVLCEACIHMLSHKRNKMEKYVTEYRSPLHLVSSQFCGYCRSHRWKEKIKQIQDKRFMRRRSRRFARGAVVGAAASEIAA